MAAAAASKVAARAAPVAQTQHPQARQTRQAVASSESGSEDGRLAGGLPRSVANIMESHFGTSFADVRVHSDEAAARDTFSRGAAAYTKGTDVYFGRGRFQPASEQGQHLIAHELAHVIQQRNGRTARSGQERATTTTQRLEDEAERAASAFSARRAESHAVLEKTSFGAEQMSVTEDIAGLRDALRGGLDSAARWVIARATGDALIQDLGRLLTRLQGMTSARLPRPVIARMEAQYEWARSVAPFWFPVPDISFHGDGSMGVAVADDIAIGAIILFVLFILLLMWLLQGLDPSIRRARERATQDLIDGIRDFFDNPPTIDPFPPTDIPPTTDPPAPDTDAPPNPDTDAPPIPDIDAPPVPGTDAPPIPANPPIPDTDAPPVEDVDPAPEPAPNPEPDDDPPPPLPAPCPFPTGLTPLDPIPMAWHKVRSLYYSPIVLDGNEYHCDIPTALPRGEPIGVQSRFWPRIGKVVQLAPEHRGSGARDFRAVLRSYGFVWGGSRHLQAEHAQDLQWAAPDGANLDTFENLWPYDGAANMSAGTTQNQSQRVSFCEQPLGPPRFQVPIQSLKRPGGYGRYFVITSIGMP